MNPIHSLQTKFRLSFNIALLVEVNKELTMATHRQVVDLLSKELDEFDLEASYNQEMFKHVATGWAHTMNSILQHRAVLTPHKELIVEIWSKISLLCYSSWIHFLISQM
jgi:hypothetical protein